MATTATATLNGGPTGGLHATTLIHSEHQHQHQGHTPTHNPGQQAIHPDDPDHDNDHDLHPHCIRPCRVDSNSSFDSGHDDGGTTSIPPPLHMSHDWPAPQSQPESSEPGSGHQRSISFDRFDDQTDSSSANKKRRKQSRPVRIPASELLDSDNPNRGPGQGQRQSQSEQQNPRKSFGRGHDYDERKRMSMEDLEEDETEENDEENDNENDNDNGGSDGDLNSNARSRSRSKNRSRSVRSRRGHSGPLNLSSKTEQEGDEEDEDEDNDLEGSLGHLSQEQRHQFQMQLQMQQLASTMDMNDMKTDLTAAAAAAAAAAAISGTKDSHRNLNPSFSPALFPLITNSPFFSFFPQPSSQQQQQQRSSTTPNPQPGTPSSSSSSAGSNHPHNYHHGSGGGGSGGNNPSSLANVSSNNSNPGGGGGGGSGSGGAGGSLQNIPPHRIFNPEAYCDLCNKEFCNKYFLKTHKANKHGVYSDIPATSSSLPPSQVMAAAAAALSISSSPSAVSVPQFLSATPANMICAAMPHPHPLSHQQQGQVQQQPPVTTTSTTVLTQSSGMNLNINLKHESGGSCSGTPHPLSLALSLESKGGGNSNSNGSQTRESFCDLCQKEFCNKYFLKRHKAKIHGIAMEGGGNSNPATAVSGSGSTPTTSGSTRTQGVGGGKSQRTHPSFNGIGEKGALPLMIGSELESLGLELVAKHIEESGGGGSGMEEGEVMGHGGNSNGMLGSDQSPESLHQKLHPLQVPLPLSLPQLGVGGLGMGGAMGENTCQFCLREFSSKSLLRSHMTKKHRLLLPTFPPFLLPFQGIGTHLFEEAHQQQMQHQQGGGQGGSQNQSHGQGQSQGQLHAIHSHLNLPSTSSAPTEDHDNSHGNNPLDQDNENEDNDNDHENEMTFDAQSDVGSGMLMLNNKDGQETDYECNQCHRSFQTIYLLRMHKSYFHPETDDMSDITAAAAEAVTKMEESSDVDSGDEKSPPLPRSRPPPSISGARDIGDKTSEPLGGVLSQSHGQGQGQGHRKQELLEGEGDENREDMDLEEEREGEMMEEGVEEEEEEDDDEEEELGAEATSDSDDLRRLQTMIMELNRVSSAAAAAAAAASSWSPPPPHHGSGVDGGRSGGRSQRSSPATGGGAGVGVGIGIGSSLGLGGNASNSSASVCPICSEEFYSSYFLQQHIQHYHANCEVAGNLVNIKSESPDTAAALLNAKKMNELYENSTSSSSGQHGSHGQGHGQGQSQGLGHGHGHTKDGGKLDLKLSSLGTGGGSGVEVTLGSQSSSSFLTPGPKAGSSNVSGVSLSSLSGSSKQGAGGGGGGSGGGGDASKRPSPSLSRSYCTICHKELCNKYFMRTHMLKMHGISIESSTGLGGVTCDICNKELCSKYFLKVHKQNTHGIVEDGPSPPNPSTPGPPIPLSLTPHSSSSLSDGGAGGGNVSLSLAAMNSGGNDLVPLMVNSQVDLQSRYYCHYSEVCPFCGRRFRSAKWLKTHLMTDHGQEGKDRWKAIEKTLQHHSSRSRGSKSSGHGGGSGSGSAGGKASGSGGGASSTSKSSKSAQKSVQKLPSSLTSSGGAIPVTSNGSNGNKCALCGFSTNDMEVMKVHLIKEHASQLASGDPSGSLGGASLGSGLNYQDPQRVGVVLDPLSLLFQKMEGGSNKLYRCAYCPFTTSLLVYLYAHERTHTGLANPLAPPQQQQQQQQSQQQQRETSPPADNEIRGSSSAGNTFQCPMCFHSFHTVETFQQHLISHQMSGVLAPFFAPPVTSGGITLSSSSTSSSRSILPFLPPPADSPTGQDQDGGGGGSGQQPFSALTLPALNGALGSSSDSLYWALKQSAANAAALEQQQRRHNNHHGNENDPEDSNIDNENEDYEENNREINPLGAKQVKIKTEPGVEDLTMTKVSGMNLVRREELEGGHPRQRQNQRTTGVGIGTVQGTRRKLEMNLMEEDDNENRAMNDQTLLLVAGKAGEESKKRKIGKISSFRCSFCSMTFKSRLDCSTHIQERHQGGGSLRRKQVRDSSHGHNPKNKTKNFRCRKCKFQSSQYQKLVVHNRVHHSAIILRGGYHSESPEKVVADGNSASLGMRLMTWNKLTDPNDDGIQSESQSQREHPGPARRQGPPTTWNNLELDSLPQGRAIPQQGVLGNYLMQGFLLSCSSDEDKFDSSSTTPPVTATITRTITTSTHSNENDPLEKNLQSQSQIQIPFLNVNLMNPLLGQDSDRVIVTSDPGRSNVTLEDKMEKKDQDPLGIVLRGTEGSGEVGGEFVDGEDGESAEGGGSSVGGSSTLTPSASSSKDKDKSSPCAKSVHSSGLFVPSLVYLPVREKVSQSVRVSFSLTPTS